MKKNNSGTHYGNWIPDDLIRKVLLLCLLIVFAWLVIPLNVFSVTVCTILSIFFFGLLAYMLAARHLFSYEGGEIQNKVLELLLSCIEWDGRGRALDIGCGGGALSIKLSKKYDTALITGIDFFEESWGFSKNQCETNAEAEGVVDRVAFLQASASRLPFEDETFDLVVSNLTFHEVKDNKNKFNALKEAIRVTKKGGRFVFQDLFLIKAYYGSVDHLLSFMRELGASDVHFTDTSKSPFIPKILKPDFMLGAIGILYGTK